MRLKILACSLFCMFCLGLTCFAETESTTGFHYWHGSYQCLFSRPSFFTSIYVNSEYGQSENANLRQLVNQIHYKIPTWNMVPGTIYFARTGSELWNNDHPSPVEYFDLSHLPGITARANFDIDHADAITSDQYFGCTGLESAGVVAIYQTSESDHYSLRKSVHFFDLGFVVLGSGITSTADENQPLHTTITQWPTPKADASLIVSGGREFTAINETLTLENVEFAWLDSVGYVFSKPVTLIVKRDRKLTTLYIDHTANPSNAMYSYIVLPDVTLQRTEHYVKQPTVRVIAHDEKVHAVEDLVTNSVSYAFWKPATLGPLAVDRPAVVFCHKDSRGLGIAVQNPLPAPATITLDIEHLATITVLPENATCNRNAQITSITFDAQPHRIYRAGLGGVVPPKPSQD